ncbi:hypothetical protein HYH03_017248 [Edaphochlamys debaryana]|uniref:Uncharacterized protein n=1 Tax=Edaphochlamys debaryana TaxID=47281 RepID=A0A836BPH1_9CHLO|nr:hypothetical protein HYH03_017248 [Edaphochlamys debaryana]|eukprot:KAG2483927.1 hypothetical protein HYH03_017248 [Edaphochlamys debaryana]
MPPRQVAAARKTALEQAAEQRHQAAAKKLRDYGAQALALKDGKDGCAWSAARVHEAAAAADQTGGSTWSAVGDEGRAGLAALLGLALRRARPAPSAQPGAVPHNLRAAYSRLRSSLAKTLGGIDCSSTAASPDILPSRLLCVALLKGHILRGYAALLASTTSSLSAQRPRPPQSSTREATLAGLEVQSLLHHLTDVQRLRAKEDGESKRLWLELASLLTDELTASRVLEHHARLVIALAACQGAEDETLSAAKSMCGSLKLVRTKHSYKEMVGPCVPYLLTSHLLALASALDGGPSFGLPLPGAAGAAGPSSSAALSPVAVVPLTDRKGRRLRLGDTRPASTEIAREALAVWIAYQRSVLNLVTANDRAYWPKPVDMPEDALPPPPGPLPPSGPAHFSERALLSAVQHCVASSEALSQWKGDLEKNRRESFLKRTTDSADRARGIVDALVRGEPYANSTAGFELSMRVAGAAARSLGGGGDLDALSPQDLEALYALHEPAQWRQGAQQAQAGQAQGQGGAGGVRPSARLRRTDALELGLDGLKLARAALGAPLSVYDPARGAGEAPAWVLRRLRAYWRAVLAWVGQEALADDAGLVNMMSLPWTSHQTCPPARPGLDVAAALSAGYLPALERLLRQRTDCPPVETRPTFTTGPASVWAEVLAFGEPAQAASLAATVAKRLLKAGAGATTIPSSDPNDLSTLDDFLHLATHMFSPGTSLSSAVVRYPDRPAPPERWPLTMSYVAARLLPAAQEVLTALAKVAYVKSQRDPFWWATHALVDLLLSWVPTLVAAACPPLPSPEGEATGSEHGGGAAVPLQPSMSAAPDAHAIPGGGSHSSSDVSGGPPPLGINLNLLLTVAEPLLRAEGPSSALVQPFQSALWALVARAPPYLAAAARAGSRTAGMSALLRGMTGAAHTARPKSLFQSALTEAANGPSDAAASGAVTRPGLFRSMRKLLREGGPAEAPALLAAVERVLGGAGAAAGAAQAGAGAGAGPSGLAEAGAAEAGAGVGGASPPVEVRR